MNKRRAFNISVCCGLILGFNAVLNVNAFAGPPVPMGPGAAGGAWAAGAMIGAGAIQNGGANGSVTVGAPPSNGRNCQEISPTYTTNNACGTGSYTYSTGSTGMQTMPAQNMTPQQPQQ
ncbi:hypothetical protein F6R98_15640 [Candidatus Methylospira mobilis]|uniref:Uncharacterized protein n=1 Tax=Candidatus Methylospira mobilis TaxID=1808979 RepID=A0A5Q0BJA0_9GAMM|nr:hypothetical protein [Candidatus Methylospira mobilis]QFY43883.1 hypothetical protein F6R98_15640 [Candidatus Methylospira mobilis]WNV04886.1 hypothetical protein RP726_00355 [Candidatus Methylospira mobilis]